MNWQRLAWLMCIGWYFAPLAARADGLQLPDGQAHAYALIVGSNRGGPGQQDLRFAELDARRFKDVLVDVGRYAPDRVRSLLQPTAKQVRSALDKVATQLAEHRQRGEQATFLFYYSGHARSDALNLGQEKLPLTDLRERIMGASANLTLVVLDACQSGAFSRVKGAAPAADFSFNSIARLNTEGVAVMASSSANELSQESEELSSSYFTHHLVVALRGAGDANDDGLVTLGEAYRYAYNRTLAATALTAVGEQHVTLEMELRGKGDLPLTYPAEANALLELPADLEGRILIQRHPDLSVMAELHKVKGEPLRLALLPGRYLATVRRAQEGTSHVLRCALELVERLTLNTGRCERVEAPRESAKGGADQISTHRRGWGIELGVGLGFTGEGKYADALEDFEFSPDERSKLRFNVAVTHELSPWLAVGAQYTTLDTRSYERRTDGIHQRFDLAAMAAGPLVRARYVMAGGQLVLYAQTSAGISAGYTTFDAIADSDADGPLRSVSETHWGVFMSGAGGMQWMTRWKLGLFVQAGYSIAPAIRNRFGDAHDSGGAIYTFGLRGQTQEVQ